MTYGRAVVRQDYLPPRVIGGRIPPFIKHVVDEVSEGTSYRYLQLVNVR